MGGRVIKGVGRTVDVAAVKGGARLAKVSDAL